MSVLITIVALFLGCTAPSTPNREPSLPPLPPVYELPDVIPLRAPIESMIGEVPECATSTTIRDGVVSIFPGETVCLTLGLDGGFLDPQASSRYSGYSVVFMRREADDGGMTRLHVVNPFSMYLKYRAGLRLPGDSNYYATTSCGVLPGGTGSEIWWQPIDEIVVAAFEFRDESAGMICD